MADICRYAYDIALHRLQIDECRLGDSAGPGGAEVGGRSGETLEGENVSDNS